MTPTYLPSLRFAVASRSDSDVFDEGQVAFITAQPKRKHPMPPFGSIQDEGGEGGRGTPSSAKVPRRGAHDRRKRGSMVSPPLDPKMEERNPKPQMTIPWCSFGPC